MQLKVPQSAHHVSILRAHGVRRGDGGDRLDRRAAVGLGQRGRMLTQASFRHLGLDLPPGIRGQAELFGASDAVVEDGA